LLRVAIEKLNRDILGQWRNWIGKVD